jgi:hypothetical protein
MHLLYATVESRTRVLKKPAFEQLRDSHGTGDYGSLR